MHLLCALAAANSSSGSRGRGGRGGNQRAISEEGGTCSCLGLCVSLLWTFCFLLPQLHLLEAEAIAEAWWYHIAHQSLRTLTLPHKHTPLGHVPPCSVLFLRCYCSLIFWKPEAIADVVVLSVVLEE